MGRTRNILDLAMAGGAIAAIITLSLPQFRQNISIGTSAFGTTVAAKAVDAQEPVEIAHFLGIAQFVKNPAEYALVCDADCGGAELEFAKITDVSLVGDQMTISYSASASDEAQSPIKAGQIVGTLDSDGAFEGVYRMRSPERLDEGPVAFTFAADGTAKGSAGTTKIAR